MNPFVEAARPKTLPAAVAPVVVGTAAAANTIVWRFFAALVVGLAVQIGVNYANDYFDAVKGVDTAARVGPRRAVASGLVSPGAMKRAIAAALGVAAVAGIALAVAAGPELLLVGALSFVAALGYSGGPKPYASAGLGELFVFVFFGLVATIGSAYVQDEAFVAVAVAAATPVGFLAVAILVVNNLRDIPTDTLAGKRTLVVRLGDARTRMLYLGLVAAALALTSVVALAARSPWPLLGLGAAALAGRLRPVTRGATGPALIAVLGATARLQLVYAGLLSLGLVLAR